MIMTIGAECGDFDLVELPGCKTNATCSYPQDFSSSVVRSMVWSFWQEYTGSAWMTSYLHGLHQPCIQDGWNGRSRPEGTRWLHVKCRRSSSTESLVPCIVDYR
jgi:hypothetical protein